MEADLYNLQPAIGEVNGRRANYRFDMIPGEHREFGDCDIEIADRRVEPRPAIRGDIARTYMYMEWAYGRRLISSADRKLFEAWNREDPVDDWERERARRIAAKVGNRRLQRITSKQSSTNMGRTYLPGTKIQKEITLGISFASLRC
jgi:deoxyribonuclease-1